MSKKELRIKPKIRIGKKILDLKAIFFEDNICHAEEPSNPGYTQRFKLDKVEIFFVKE